MVEVVKEAPNNLSSENPDCRHHWIIAPPNGPTSLGICIFCETWGDFPNSIDQTVSSEVLEHMAIRLTRTTIWDKIISESLGSLGEDG